MAGPNPNPPIDDGEDVEIEVRPYKIEDYQVSESKKVNKSVQHGPYVPPARPYSILPRNLGWSLGPTRIGGPSMEPRQAAKRKREPSAYTIN